MSLAMRLLTSRSPDSAFYPPAVVPPDDDSWTRSGSNPILSPTAAWEQTAVSEVAAVFYTAGAWQMWYSGGWGRPGIGYATSSDGITWTKSGSNPVYGQGGSGYANSACSGRVFKNGATYYLYVSGGPTTGSGDLRTTFRVATSTDGIAWTTQAHSISFPAGGQLWGNREVWIEDGTWYLLQEVMVSSVWSAYLYTSADGLTWTIANGGAALETLRVAAGGCVGGSRFSAVGDAPVPKIGGIYHLWYHASDFAGNLPTDIYHATSSDLITWTITPATPVLTHTGAGFEIDQVAGPVPIVVGGTAYLFYDGDDNSGAGAAKIGLATAAVLFV